MKAEIIAVGTEILLGDIVNTNAQYLSKSLAELGIEVYYQSVIGDNENRLIDQFQESFNRSDLVITTGGLGPTKDDLTKECAAKYFNEKLYLDENSLKRIEQYFIKTGRKINEGNKKQAYFPKDAIILTNNNGTAPGCIINSKGKILILLPGPPKEVVPMFKESVIPYLKKLTDCTIISKTLKICGIGEGHMAEKISHIINKQTNPTVAPYAKEGEVTLRITAKANSKEEANKLIEPMEKEIRNILKDDIYGEESTTLEDVVGDILIKNNISIGVAESCTGGLLSGKLINYPGISAVFKEGMVTYSNESKIIRLGVRKETLEKYTSVSKEVALEMAEGIAKAANSDVGISTTGVAGPAVSDGNPVGLVFIGLYIKGKTFVKMLEFNGNREKIRNLAVINALDMLRRELYNIL